LASFKGTRQPTTTQEAISLKEIDPTGFFGSEVAMGKVDAVADKVARLLQEYLKLVTTDEDTNIDLEALAPKIDQLNQIVEQIKNYKSKTGSEGFKDQKSYTLDEIEAVIANQ
jgi:Na+/phosphate symporter